LGPNKGYLDLLWISVSVLVYFAHRAGAPRQEFFHWQVSIKTVIWHVIT